MIPLPENPGLAMGVRSLKGVGPSLEKALVRRGFETVADLLTLMPVRYQDRRSFTKIKDLAPDMEALVCGRIESVKEGRLPKKGRRYFEIIIEDDTGVLTGFWFSFPAHLRATVKKGLEVRFFGRVQAFRDRLQMVHPDFLTEASSGPPAEIRPVYPDMEDVRAGTLRRIMGEALRELKAAPTIFPSAWLAEHGLTDPVEALRILHKPPTDRPGRLPRPSETRAWRSLAFFELFFLQLALARSRAAQNQTRGRAFPRSSRLAEAYVRDLPFRLTESQARVIEEIKTDMASDRPMNRLLQGDVGSGKTVVSLVAALTAVDGGGQAALMVPTEILARQHFRSLSAQTRGLGLRTDLLVGGLSEAEKKEIRARLASGETRLVVGTHALISRSIEFKDLGLAIVDEQHRFGVAQRLSLRAKARQADILVMTATPIPRTLALTLYGDLDLSVISGLPPGRSPSETMAFGPEERPEAYELLRREVEKGGQAYIVAPRIDPREDEDDDPAAAESLFRSISEDVLPGFKVGLVHGRMKSDEQQAVMDSFRQGRLRALTATTVIEVGLDVPEATVILVEGAERFGLAQLHQLRGRIGRGHKPGLCLLTADQPGPLSLQRLELMTRINDGFTLAEEDLKLRGPGEATGLKQSGLPAMTWAELPQDLPLLIKTRDLASELAADDPGLEAPDFRLVREVVERLEKSIKAALASVG